MKKILFSILMFIAVVAMAEQYEHVGVCVPIFGVPGTIEGVTYTASTAYIYTPSVYSYYYYPTVTYVVPPPRPPHFRHHHHHAPPPPPPPHYFNHNRTPKHHNKR